MRAFFERRAAWIAAACALAGGLLTMTAHPVGVFYDDAIYLLVAKAIAEGHGYVYAFLPGSPPAIHYPPLWPVILAAAWKVTPAFPGNIAWFLFINPLLVGICAGATVVFGRRVLGLPTWLAFFVAVLATVSVPVLVLTNVLLSEPLFLALLFPTLLVTERFAREGGVRWAVAAAAMAALIVLGRTIAGVIVVATVMVLVLDKRWRDVAIYTLVVVVLLGPWQYFVWKSSPGFPEVLKGSYGPYLDWVADGYREGGLPFLRDVLVKNLYSAWLMTSFFISPLIRGPVRELLTAGTLSLFLAGLVLFWTRRRLRITALATVGYAGVVLAWPFQVERFVWAVWPLLLLITVTAAYDLVNGLRTEARPRVSVAVLVLAVTLGAGHIAYNIRGLARGYAESAARDMSGRSMVLVQYINADTRLHGKLIATEVAPMVALYTGQTVVPVEMLTTREHIERKTDAENVETVRRIDAAYRPDAYVLLPQGAHLRALLQTGLDSTRGLREVTPVGVPVRSFLTNRP